MKSDRAGPRLDAAGDGDPDEALCPWSRPWRGGHAEDVAPVAVTMIYPPFPCSSDFLPCPAWCIGDVLTRLVVLSPDGSDAHDLAVEIVSGGYMRHDWIFDVLSDLKAYAMANNLPALAAKADEALIVARAEIEDGKTRGNGTGGTGGAPPSGRAH